MQLCVSRLNSSQPRTQPWRDPVLTVMGLDVVFHILTVCFACVRRQRTQLQMLVSMFSDFNISTSCCGIIVLKAKLKLIKSTLASRWYKIEWSVVVTASSV